MRTLVCGDLHCKPFLLERALSATKWDKFVFLGDACDNWGATQEDNLQMIKLLMETKKKYGEKFVWLIGNHDWGYYDDTIRMTGHILAGSANVRHLLEEAIEDWEIFYSDGLCTYSHAGLSTEFLIDTKDIPYKELKTARGINNPLNRVGYACGGIDRIPGPLWIRPSEMDDVPTELCKYQVVGHTPVEKITKQGSLIICDTMSQYSNGDYIGDKSLLLVEDDKIFAINGDNGRIINELSD